MIAVLLLALAQVATPAVPAPAGDWIVDLTSKPGDPPYRQPMRLELKPNGTVTGKFYRSDIQAGRWKTDRKRTCVGFRTTDGAVPYHTAACQTGGDGHRADLGRAPEFPVELECRAGGVAMRRQD